ncbi:MAG TPA: dihydroorotate dehydrogenase electron transfer subunit [Tepidisphaeraceae bacterium]|jgi:dihydroorotate dehydrogenase electron transfer subunit
MNSSRGQFRGEVVANLSLCREHFKLILRVPGFPSTRPGQFVQLTCEDDLSLPEGEWLDQSWPQLTGIEVSQREAFLRRPFSLAGRRDVNGEAELSIIHRIVGVGTGWMSRLGTGQTLSLIGPLGNSFRPPAANQTAILVGGGVGIPPMLYWAQHLKGHKAVAICGALSRELLPLQIIDDNKEEKPEARTQKPAESTPSPCTQGDGTGGGSSSSFSSCLPAFSIAEFADCGIPSLITTDDGSLGTRGFVTAALTAYLDSINDPAVIYTCGPEPMMKAVANIAIQRNIECQVAVERAMACGMGTCQSCVIRVKKPDPAKPPLAGSPWCYRLACTDGPIFTAQELLW